MMQDKEQFNLIKAIVLISVATGIVGISLGSVAASFDVPMWIPLLLSLTVLAGAAEFTFIGMIATGTNPIFAALTGILINLRHLPFGLSVATFIEKNAYRFIACHIMNDESVMFGLSQQKDQAKHDAFIIHNMAGNKSISILFNKCCNGYQSYFCSIDWYIDQPTPSTIWFIRCNIY